MKGGLVFATLVVFALSPWQSALADTLPTAPNFQAALKCTEPVPDKPLWESRCYNGTVTLQNYNTLESLTKRLESELGWALVQDLVGARNLDDSGQFVNVEQLLATTVFMIVGGHLGWAHDVASFSEDIRMTGPVFQGKGFDTHQRVRIFYSDGVVQWLKNGRKGDIANGEVIVKQMYASNPLDATYGADRVSGWAIMTRNSNLSKDGWTWTLFFYPGSPPYGAPLPVVYSQTGDNFCLSCHAAVDNDLSTFSALENLEGAHQQYSWIFQLFPGMFPPEKTDQPTGDGPYRAIQLASGTAQFQRLAQLAAQKQDTLKPAQGRDFLKNFRVALQTFKNLDPAEKEKRLARLIEARLPHLKDGFDQLSHGAIDASGGALTPSGAQLVALLDRLLQDIEGVVKGDVAKSLNDAMELYYRFLAQGQTVAPLDKPNPDILAAFSAQSQVPLPKTQNDMQWLPLDFLFSHTPALPESLPKSVCELHRGTKVATGGVNSILLGGDVPNKTVFDETEDCRNVFVTADNCNGCHWSYVLQGNSLPYMVTLDANGADPKDPSQSKLWDISPYAEWSASMMGLAGRDPIFHAQMAWEERNNPEIAKQTENFCLRCHQAGAQRQFHLDNGDPNDEPIIVPPPQKPDQPLFTNKYTYLEPSSVISNATKYGALGRDGITCTVCHQIEAEGLGTPETFTGNFKFPTKPDLLYGPYPTDDVKPFLMEQSIGYTPVFGEQVQDSALCGSCHTVITPIVSEHLEAFKASNGKYRTTYEQTTFPEWLNSDFAKEGGQSCQECHMPSRTPDQDEETPGGLDEIIANVETAYLPPLPNRAADDLITPVTKSDYRRHTLIGLNVFANQMFQQFPNLLGNSDKNIGGMPQAHAPLVLAEKEMLRFAQNGTVDVSVSNKGVSDGNMTFDVTVANKVGHKFPSGVGFRRGFIRFEALDANGKVLWASGRTNAAGQLIDGEGKVLLSEKTKNPLQVQPGVPNIAAEDEVYLFEELTATPRKGLKSIQNANGPQDLKDMTLTTSFLEIAAEVKDTRLLPKGWSKTGPYADVTTPSYLDVKTGRSVPFYPVDPGVRTVRYAVPANVGNVAKVAASIQYQSIPPYYIQDRLEFDTPEARRLYYMVAHLNVEDTAIAGWVLELVREELDVK